jgi:IclR helix-turn-helix domain
MAVDLTVLQLLSRAAFGQAYRLQVMLAIADSEDGLVTLSELARSIGTATSNVQAPLRSLIECGLLTEMPRGDSRSKFLLRNPSPAWDWARHLYEQAGTESAADSALGATPTARRVRGPS